MTETGTDLSIYKCKTAAVQSANVEFEHWKQVHSDAMLACDADDWARECIQIGESAIADFARVFDALRHNRLRSDLELLGNRLDQFLTATVNLFDAIGELGALLKKKGFHLDTELKFKETRASLLRTEERFRQVWPKRDDAIWQKTAEQISEDDFQFAEDVLHAIQTGGPQRD